MRPLEFLRLSWRSIRGHALRSSLTTLGVVIGIAAVIAFVTLGASLQAGILGDISPDDRRNVYGWAAESDVEGGPLAGAQPAFSERDVAELDERPGIDAAYGYATIPTQALVRGDDLVPRGDALIAAGPPYVREETLAEGRRFEAGEREAVLNPAAAGAFEENASVGDEITVVLQGGGETSATVVGITDRSEGLSPFEGFEAAPRVYVPTDPYYTEGVAGLGIGQDEAEGSQDDGDDGEGGAGDGDGEGGGGGDDGDGEGSEGGQGDDGAGGEGDGSTGGQGNGSGLGGIDGALFAAIVVEAESAADEDVDRARESARSYLESEESDAGELLDDDLEVVMQTSTELLGQLRDVLGLLRDFVVGIAAISLLVGAIGIANIMLVSVTERTREIGIMKAVGGQNRDVLGLFLTEAILLGVAGAVLGTALGLLAGYAGARYVGLPLVYPVEYVALAVVVGVAVGVAAGLYPAWRAARTDPIDALRYE